jgi:uncharacterized protein YjbJ (UPF0337 family)
MNWDQIAGNWSQFKGYARERWGQLTDDDLTVVAGKRERLTEKLLERYGYGKRRSENELDDFLCVLTR